MAEKSAKRTHRPPRSVRAEASGVPSSTYTVRAALKGLKTYERSGIRVAMQQFITVDVSLELGSLLEGSRSPPWTCRKPPA